MAWTWVRPTDPSLLHARPLVDLGTGNGQTLSALVEPGGLVIGVDRAPSVLRAARGAGTAAAVCAEASALPFAAGSVGAVLAADLFHHLDDRVLDVVAAEIARTMRHDAQLVAWWYESPPHPAPDAPRFPRRVAVVGAALQRAGFANISDLDLHVEPGGPATVGVVARKTKPLLEF